MSLSTYINNEGVDEAVVIGKVGQLLAVDDKQRMLQAPGGTSGSVTVGTQLTGAGVTDPIDVTDYKNHSFQIIVASIGTSVTVRVEGSHDGTNYFNMAASGSDTTYTSNDIYLLSKDNFKTQFARVRLVSEVGATVTLDISYMGGN